MNRDCFLGWPASSYYGWGVRGLNFLLHWDGVAGCAVPGDHCELPPDDPRRELLADRLGRGRFYQQQVLSKAGYLVYADDPVLVSLGNDLTEKPVAFGRWLRGKPHIACAVFEDVEKVEKNVHRLKDYDAVVVASRWNQEVLASLGVKSHLCHEGVDTTIFNPTVRSRLHDGRFRVFSGGKVEKRKGQDLVVEAFKIFAEKHDNAVLVACWSSPFGWAARDLDVPGAHIGKPNFHAWVERLGLKPHQFEYVEPRANWRMAEVYGQCDVALFPNRCEGGTNFVAMEVGACDIPQYIRPGYGHSDVIGLDYPIDDGDALVQMIYVLEMAYAGQHTGRLAWQTKSDMFTWPRHCREMAEIIANA